jgi:hypothetical protein
VIEPGQPGAAQAPGTHGRTDTGPAAPFPPGTAGPALFQGRPEQYG